MTRQQGPAATIITPTLEALAVAAYLSGPISLVLMGLALIAL